MRLATACVAMLWATLASATERMEQFGYAVPITLAPGDALYALRLPASVYRHTARANLADLRVYNAAGEAVAHAVQRPKASSSSRRTARTGSSSRAARSPRYTAADGPSW